MNNTDEILSCICLPNEISIAISVIGIVLPLVISEVLPFCNCDPNGILHGLFIKLNCKKNVVVHAK